MKKLLLLHHRADCNTNDMWRAAVRSGWATERVDMAGRFNTPADTSTIRYYGNTLHAAIVADKLPVKFLPLDLTVLARTPHAKRGIDLIHAGELTESAAPRFIKPAENKWFPANVYQPGDSPARAQGGAGLPSDLIYVQEPVDMINELRCFVLDGQIHTASYYRIGREYCPAGTDECDNPAEVEAMVADLAPHYPRGVVLDFAYTAKGDWCFIEPNEAWGRPLCRRAAT